MNSHRIPHAARCLLAAGLFAGLFAGVAAAQAASGYTIEPSQEALVKPGMSAAEVQQLLGQPARQIHYGNEPGPTFSYHLISAEQAMFDVDFAADGTVASVTERMEGGGRRGRR